MDFSQNPQALEALRLMEETRRNIFLTGEAGTGKSTLLDTFRRMTKKKTVVLAPTGVAAVNVGGQTIHSFCNFKPAITISKVRKASPWSGRQDVLKNTDIVIIDEISMVRADLLDCVDKFFRLSGPKPDEPFGGLQMVFVGDLHQLPPIEKDFSDARGLFREYESPYFFHAKSYAAGHFETVVLTTAYRQSDPVFLSVLNAIRNNRPSDSDLDALNARALSDGNHIDEEDFGIYLTTKNYRADQVNNHFLSKIPAQERTYTARIFGIVHDKSLRNQEVLKVKEGARVMLLTNDRERRWFNGTIGTVVGFEAPTDIDSVAEDAVIDTDAMQDDDGIRVELESGEIVTAYPHSWELFEYYRDRETGMLETRILGTFTQYPLRLAWALTIHKSQGLTFNKVYVDLADGTFAHGQLYVALSRCRTLEGLTLRRPVTRRDVLLDSRVIEFTEGLG